MNILTNLPKDHTFRVLFLSACMFVCLSVCMHMDLKVDLTLLSFGGIVFKSFAGHQNTLMPGKQAMAIQSPSNFFESQEWQVSSNGMKEPAV